MKVFIPTDYEVKVWSHYNATQSAIRHCNIHPIIENLKIIDYEFIKYGEIYPTLGIEELVKTKSKQYSKGNIIDEWIWKYPELIKDRDSAIQYTNNKIY